MDPKTRSLRHAVIDKYTCGKPMSTTRCITKFPARRSTPGGTKFSLGTNSSISMSDAVRNSMSLTSPACSISAQHTTVLDVTAGRDTNEIVLVSGRKINTGRCEFSNRASRFRYHIISRCLEDEPTIYDNSVASKSHILTVERPSGTPHGVRSVQLDPFHHDVRQVILGLNFHLHENYGFDLRPHNVHSGPIHSARWRGATQHTGRQQWKGFAVNDCTPMRHTCANVRRHREMLPDGDTHT